MTAIGLAVLALLLLASLQDIRSRRVPLAWAALALGAAAGLAADPARALAALMALLAAALPRPAGRAPEILALLHPAGLLLWPAAAAVRRGRMGMGDLAGMAAVGAAFPWPALVLAWLALLLYLELRRLLPGPEELPAMPAIAFGAALAAFPGAGIWALAVPLLAVRLGMVPDRPPYEPAGAFGDLPFWPGSLTLLAGPPGAMKTSWALRMAAEASERMPAAFACYEHTPEELAYRLRRMAAAMGRDPSRWGRLLLLAPLRDREDTVRAVEERLLEHGFPASGPAFLAVDYLQRVPIYGLEGPVPEARRGGEAAAALRDLARRRGWIVLAVSGVRAGAFGGPPDLAALLGDERIAYEADRVIWLRRPDPADGRIAAQVLKDRAGRLRELLGRASPKDFLVAFPDEGG